MGTSIGINCEVCHYEVLLRMGEGFSYESTLENLRSNFLTPKQRMFLDQSISGDPVKSVSFYEGLFFCDKCLYLQGRLRYSITTVPGRQIASSHKCSRCKRELQKFDIRESDVEDAINKINELGLRCKKCQSPHINVSPGILWDWTNWLTRLSSKW